MYDDFRNKKAKKAPAMMVEDIYEQSQIAMAVHIARAALDEACAWDYDEDELADSKRGDDPAADLPDEEQMLNMFEWTKREILRQQPDTDVRYEVGEHPYFVINGHFV